MRFQPRYFPKFTTENNTEHPYLTLVDQGQGENTEDNSEQDSLREERTIDKIFDFFSVDDVALKDKRVNQLGVIDNNVVLDLKVADQSHREKVSELVIDLGTKFKTENDKIKK